MALAGCGQDRPRIVLPPAELASCRGEPLAPDLPVQDWHDLETARAVQAVRDPVVLEYILTLRAAWGDCRAKVDGLKVWRERAGE